MSHQPATVLVCIRLERAGDPKKIISFAEHLTGQTEAEAVQKAELYVKATLQCLKQKATASS